MNGLSVPQSGVLSGYRSLAHVIAGLEFFAVVGLLLHVIGEDIPGWSHVFGGSVTVGAILLVAAYPVGLIVDEVATRLWARIARKPDKPDQLRDWLAIRTGHPKEGDPCAIEADLRDPATWRAAQRWIWTSREAAAELGDLRVRLMLGKDTALNAALAVLVAAAAPFLSFALRGDEIHSRFWILVVLGLATGAFVTCALRWRLANPDPEGRWRRPPRTDVDTKDWVAAATLLVTGDFIWWAVAPDFVWVPRFLPWLVGVTALGPLAVFGFAYVRITANRLYHGLVQEAARIEPP